MRLNLAKVVCGLLVVFVMAGCAPAGFEPEGRALGRVDTPEQAADAARALTSFAGPIRILQVRSGIARELYSGAYPSWVSGNPEMERAHDRFMAKLERQAWRVDLVTGVPSVPGDCVWEELIIDQQTGSVLLSECATGIPENS